MGRRRRGRSEVWEPAQREADPVAVLIALARGHVVFCRRDVARVMMALRMEFDRREHPVGRAVREVEKRNIERLTRLIEAGRRDGSIPPGPPLAPALLGAIEGLAMVVAGTAARRGARRARRPRGARPRAIVSSGAMDAELERYLDGLWASGREHDAELPDRTQRLRNVEPETVRMLAVLVRATGARRVLELGTSNGYSTLWLADATAGRVLTVELDAGRARQARENFATTELADAIELVEADGGEVLANSADGTFDFVFLDAERPLYTRWWPDLLRTLASPGLLVVDNVISHAGDVEAFRALVDAEPAVTSALVPIGAGTLLVTRAA